MLGGVLDVRLGAGFTPAVGTSFRIIDNTGTARASEGIFFGDTQGRPLDRDGASFAAGGLNFVINYHGGDGNDVVITRDSAPAFVNRTLTTTPNGLATLRGHITEPDVTDTFFLDVNWGDGTETQTYVFVPGTSRDVLLTHQYANQPGARHYDVQLIWRDNHGGSNAAAMALKLK